VGGSRVRASLYAAALASGGSFAILFTGETYDGSDGGFGGFSVVAIIAGYKAFLPLLLAAAVAVAVGSAGRYRFVLLFPATALYTQFAVYGWPPLFSLSEWREFMFKIGTDVYEAAGIMYTEPVPYDLTPGLFVVLIPVVMIVVTFATSATLYEESPVISVAILGLTIGVLSTISFEDGAGPFFAVFLVSAVALLLSSGAVGAEGLGRPGMVAGALVVALVLTVPKMPLSDVTVSPGFIDWTRIGTGGTSRLDVQADVGDYLTAGRDAELMRVRSSEPLLWRGGTLDYFDGIRWSDTVEPGAEDGEEIAPGVKTEPVVQRVQVLNAQTDLIFGGYKIINTSQDSATENSDGSWSRPGPLEEDTYYEVISQVPQPTTAQLQAAGTAYPALVEEKFLQLPEGRPEIIAETARRIERDYDPRTPYERARAIERYLIYDGGFVYNLDVSYRRADKAIEEFLGDDREGFCTQFATSMALLLRELDVPSRVVYGATPGEEVEPGEYIVTGSDMHTWVEAYFPGVGWYPFDPTPGFAMPTAMQANAPRPELPNTPPGAALMNPNVTQQARGGEEASRQLQDAPEDRAVTPSGEENVPAWPLLVLVPTLLAAAVPLAKKALLVRGRPEDLYRDLTGRLRDTLPPGRGIIADSPALTPTERVLLLAGAVGLEEGPMREFARAYSEHLYSPRPAPDGSRRVSAAYRRAIQAFGCLPLWRRVLGAINPASLLVRARRSGASWRTRLGKALRGRLGKRAGASR
jgi:transglutaminase-like putative cysteine protease